MSGMISGCEIDEMRWTMGSDREKAKEDKTKDWKSAVSPTEDCLPVGVLERIAERAALSENRKAVTHLLECPRCQLELAMLRSFASESSADGDRASAEWIAARLHAPRATLRAVPLPRMFPWGVLAKGPYPIAAMSVFVAILGISFYIYREPADLALHMPSTTAQTMRSGDVRVIQPSGDLSQLPRSFDWEAFPGATSYSIEVLEVDGTLVWSAVSKQNTLVLNQEFRDKLHPGKPFLWRVSALSESGKSLASSGREGFRIKTGYGR